MSCFLSLEEPVIMLTLLMSSIEYLISILGTDPKQARALILGNGA